MTCVTPSNPDSIPFGESQDISDTLARTSGGSLFTDGRDMSAESSLSPVPIPHLPDSSIIGDQHRVDQTEFLIAQTASKPAEIMKLWKQSIENARKAPLCRSNSRVGGKNLGAIVDEPLKKIRSIRFEQDDEALHPRGSPTPLQRRRTSPRAAVAKKKTKGDLEFDDIEDEGSLPEEFEEEENFSLHRPMARVKV